jgi:hypothetical protein
MDQFAQATAGFDALRPSSAVCTVASGESDDFDWSVATGRPSDDRSTFVEHPQATTAAISGQANHWIFRVMT